jgi:cysteine desulfuration protein SufE
MPTPGTRRNRRLATAAYAIAGSTAPPRAPISRARAHAMNIDEIIDNFAVLDDWDDRYRYVIELGRELEPLPERARADANKVQGCASQVWLATSVKPNGAGGPILTFAGDSDAHIVRGLIAILFAFYSGRSAREILDRDAIALFNKLGLREHLTPQRSNGFKSMVERIKADARSALAA